MFCARNLFPNINNNNIIFDIIVHFHILSACHPPQKLLNGMYINRKKEIVFSSLNIKPIINAIIKFRTTSHNKMYPYLYIFISSVFNTFSSICLLIMVSTIFCIILHSPQGTWCINFIRYSVFYKKCLRHLNIICLFNKFLIIIANFYLFDNYNIKLKRNI